MLLAVVFVGEEIFERVHIGVVVNVTVLSNLSLQVIDLVEEVLEGDELTFSHSRVSIAQIFHDLIDPSLVLIGRFASQVWQVRHEEFPGGDAPLVIGQETVELVAPKIFSELILQVKEVLEGDQLFVVEKRLTETKIGPHEVLFTSGYGAGIQSCPVLLLVAGLSARAERAEELGALRFGQLALGVLLDRTA